MDLIERYLGAVRWNLPAGAKADDIIAELRDVLTSQVEDREAMLDRPLTRDEVSILLKEFGHPLAVAGRYHGQRTLIGPEAFPFYWFVLRIVLAITAVIEAIEIGGRLISGRTLAQALTQGAHDATASLLLNAAVVTLIFAVIERSGWLASYTARWKPESLPSLPQIEARPRRAWEPVLGIAFSIGFLAWWTGALPIDWMPRDSEVAVHAAPVWAGLHWAVIALISGRILQDLASLLVPTWKPLRAMIMLGCAAGTVAIATELYEAGRLVIVTPLTAAAAQAMRMQEGLDTALHMAVIVVGALSIWQCVVELWKLYRERR